MKLEEESGPDICLGQQKLIPRGMMIRQVVTIKLRSECIEVMYIREVPAV